MDPIVSFLMLMVIILILIIAALGLSNRIIFKMAVRNFTRRKAQSVIVIAGLMIGTAIISSALVVSDTMTNTFEVDAYRSLGEVDEEIWGSETWSTVTFYRYFNESIYHTISENLSTVSGIESIAPVVIDIGAVFDIDTRLGEPIAMLMGLDSQVMRSTSFGDLDGKGFFTDGLGVGEIAMNSRLANEIEASVGDRISLSYAAKTPSSPMGTTTMKENFTVSKIINEEDLYGKANYNQQKTIFFELDTLQALLNRPNEINKIWISNTGDYRDGESYTSKVNKTIEEELDLAIGMEDVGFTVEKYLGALVLTNTRGFFPLTQASTFLEMAEIYNGSVSIGLTIPALAVNGIPINNSMIIGGESEEEEFRDMYIEPGTIHFDYLRAANLNITNNTDISVTTLGLDGNFLTMQFRAIILPPDFVSPIPDPSGSIMGYVEFETGQNMLHGGLYEDMVSVVVVSDLPNSTLDLVQTSTIEQMNNDFGASEINIEVHNVKADDLETARIGGESLGTLFMIFGMFSIIAGIVLIINIFVMLGEERKSEMGMARAIGMKGKHLVRMYIFEGSIYAFAAAIVGAFLGLFFGWLLIQAFEFIFSSVEEFGTGSFNIPFYFNWSSVFIAFCIGLFITFVTIIFASTRISKLNIIRAIRRIPEPKPERAERRVIIGGVLLIVFGFYFVYLSFISSLGGYYLAGIPMIFLGLALIVHKWTSIRAAMTAAGLAILVFMFMPYDLSFTLDWDFTGLDAFVFSGVFSVLAAIIVVMFNSNILLVALQKIFGRSKSTRAVLKTAISYPMDSKFKTGMTLGMFALIIFTVTVIAMIAAMQAAQSDIMLEQQSGDYDIIGITNPTTPFVNLTLETLPGGIDDKVEQLEIISQEKVYLLDYDEKEAQAAAYGPPTETGRLEEYNILGASDSFLSTNGFTLQDRAERFESDTECWQALAENSSYCIVDGTRLGFSGIAVGGPPQDMGGVYVGGTITITDKEGQNRTRELTVIGIMDQMFFFNGIVMKKDVVDHEYGGSDSMIVVKLKPGEDADSVAKEFEVNYLDLGLQTFDMKGIINTILTLTNNIMYLMQGFLGIGLLVGIAGIGIISYRNVVERRQQIGMLRAIGFKKKMVTKSFLIETSFITILAILIGIILGIGIGWQIYDDSGFRESGIGFTIPWLNLLAISAIAYIATLIFTFYPSIKAAKVAPAEALRYIE
jgi:putative ABC transport system permease protein